MDMAMLCTLKSIEESSKISLRSAASIAAKFALYEMREEVSMVPLSSLLEAIATISERLKVDN